ncbi:hypothetical protein BS47DRAFT_1345124 [Hydnum rufescens UP504]|uniref:J domain-containing protein n=1 Tax=Hydnum rufescens UP504 TaxID=1448309 RepID=A0A9P6DSZ8_9AGAM|nr:hypothetical protein BS47DRAFT_1345124 [Hydnum rufescens UP504]
MSESNRDEAVRCLNIARRHRDTGNLEAALKFCRKSIALYETNDAVTFLRDLQEPLPTSSSSSSGARRSTPPPPQQPSPDPGIAKDDSERVATVRRIRACKATQYYEIMGLEKTCSDQDIKRAYRKLAILTHPDKSDVEGAAEAFKMVGKAWQVLGDSSQRAQYDAAPEYDPTSRFSPAAHGHPQFRGDEISPEELFNMFFGGDFNGGGRFGGGPVFSASFGPNGFQRNWARRQATPQQQNAPTTSPLLQVLPIIIIFVISILGSLPSLANLFVTPDPGYSFTPSRTYGLERVTSIYKVPYYVNKQEFETHPIYESIPLSARSLNQAGTVSPKLRSFENGVERVYVGSLRNGCNRELEDKERRMEQHRGFFGFGGDWEKVKQIQAEVMPSCQRLRDMGLLSY